MTVANFDIGSNFIRFEESLMKNFQSYRFEIRATRLSSFKRETRMLSCLNISYVSRFSASLS